MLNQGVEFRLRHLKVCVYIWAKCLSTLQWYCESLMVQSAQPRDNSATDLVDVPFGWSEQPCSAPDCMARLK